MTVLIVADATAPRLVAADPAPGAVIVPSVIREVSAAFNEPIASPVTAATFTLAGGGGDGRLGTADDITITGAVTYDSAEKAVKFTASEPLPAGVYLPQPECELVLNDTTIEYQSAGTLDLAAGVLRGTGSINTGGGPSKVINRGVLRPGNPTGKLTIRGGFEQTPSGELVITLAAAGFSQLVVDQGAGHTRWHPAGGACCGFFAECWANIRYRHVPRAHR